MVDKRGSCGWCGRLRRADVWRERHGSFTFQIQESEQRGQWMILWRWGGQLGLRDERLVKFDLRILVVGSRPLLHYPREERT